MPARTLAALEVLRRERDEAWRIHVGVSLDADHDAVARATLEDPSRHEWRLVDAAMERLLCAACGQELGAGSRGWDPCDIADGFRFAAQEPDRPGVPMGNEHAVRVSSTILRMPRREQKVRLDQILRGSLAFGPLLEKARTFEEILELAESHRESE